MREVRRKIVLGLLLGCSGALAHTEHKSGPAMAGPEQKAWGIAGEAKRVNRTVTATMSDQMRFSPARITVREGETIRFVLRNQGKLMHEFVIGTRKDLEEHAAMMRQHPDMRHDEPYIAHVAPGKSGEIVWNFNRAGDFDFACLIAGHFEAGMVGTITVAAK